MGCGCSRKGAMAKRARTLRPASAPRSLQNTVNTPNPAEIRALGNANAVSLGESRRMDNQRLTAEKLRRAAIKKRLNK